LKKKLTKKFQNCNIEIQCVFTSVKVGSYFSLKDKTSSLLEASLIYKFQCSGDPSCTYIGKTKRYLQQRISEHSRGESAVYSHVQKCPHCSFGNIQQNFHVIKHVQGTLDLSMHEALAIRKHNPVLNKHLFNEGTCITLKMF